MRPFASTPASRATRKKKHKLKLRYWKPTPERLLRQRDGDFPVLLRPAGAPPETRDLQDAALDAEAAAAEADHFRASPLPKPHKVREAIEERGERRRGDTAPSAGSSFATVSAFRRSVQRTGAGPEIAEFDPQRDLNEEEAAEYSAMKARALAKRNYKWMPNPFGQKPGALGPGPEAEARYYERYFDGRRPAEDSGAPGVRGTTTGEEFRDGSRVRPRRERISPKRFWYQPEYITPDPPSVALMGSRELKFAMVNEAHAVRKWRGRQPEGRAAGLPPGSERLWLAFGLRAAELSHSVPAASSTASSSKPGAGPRSADAGDPPSYGRPEHVVAPGDASLGSAVDAEEAARGRRPLQRCSLSTTLRFLQAMASVQAGPLSAMKQLLSRVLEHLGDLRPHQCFFLLQAMSRLRIKHEKAPKVLQRMSLAWRTLPHKKLIKAANAVAKLDLGDQLWAQPLKLALMRTLPQLSGKHLANLKFITVAELLDDPEALRSYLTQAEVHRVHSFYSRHLQMVELHVHLLHRELWESLDESVRLFLQEVRQAAEQRSEANRGLRAASEGFGSGDDRGARVGGSTGSASSGSDEPDADSGSEEEHSDDEEGGFEAAVRSRRPAYDKARFSSALHQDISRVLRSCLCVEHLNRVAAGPLTVDMCHMQTMTIIEAAPAWQFYLRSPQMTALARRRQELLQAMGFKVVRIPYHRWEALDADDEAKASFLREKLPPGLLPRLAG